MRIEADYDYKGISDRAEKSAAIALLPIPEQMAFNLDKINDFMGFIDCPVHGNFKPVVKIDENAEVLIPSAVLRSP